MKSLDEQLAFAEKNGDAKTVLHSKRVECDCNFQQ